MNGERDGERRAVLVPGPTSTGTLSFVVGALTETGFGSDWNGIWMGGNKLGSGKVGKEFPSPMPFNCNHTFL